MQQSITCDGAVCGNGDSQSTNIKKSTKLAFGGYELNPYTLQQSITCDGAVCGNGDSQTTTINKKRDLAFGLYTEADLYKALQMTVNCDGADCGNHDTQITSTTTTKKGIFYELP